MKCTKATYATESSARRALVAIQNNPRHNLKGKRRKNPPCDYYRCRRCGLWHLTSKTKEQYEAAVSAHSAGVAAVAAGEEQGNG
jgi:hypothetical protein